MDLDLAVTNAMHRIEDLYHETGGKCYVSFSGGKDSTVLLALIKMCEEIYTIPEGGIPAVFANTGIELGVTYDFVKWVKANYYSNVQIIRPAVSFDWVLKNKGKPMKSKLKAEMLNRWHTKKRTDFVKGSLIYGKLPTGTETRRTMIADKDMHMIHDDFPIIASDLCCKYMKKEAFYKYEDEAGMHGGIVGIRVSEGGARQLSANRRVKHGGKLCTFYQKGKYLRKAPIIDWTDEEVDTFVEKYEVPLSKAYTEFGFARTGCMACPFSRQLDIDLKYLYDNEPNRYKAAMHWLKDVYIAQNVVLPFDLSYERERERMWREVYEPMRQEMLRKYRPHSRLLKDEEQTTIFDFLDGE